MTYPTTMLGMKLGFVRYTKHSGKLIAALYFEDRGKNDEEEQDASLI